MKKIAVFLFLIMALSSSSVQAMDLFTGTLEVKDGRPLLVRCDLVKNTYILVDLQGSSQAYMDQMEKLGVTTGGKFQATIFGEGIISEGQNILVVESIEEVKAGSCHLDSMF